MMWLKEFGINILVSPSGLALNINLHWTLLHTYNLVLFFFYSAENALLDFVKLEGLRLIRPVLSSSNRPKISQASCLIKMLLMHRIHRNKVLVEYRSLFSDLFFSIWKEKCHSQPLKRHL